MLPWQLPVTCEFFSLQPLAPAPSAAICERRYLVWEERKWQTEESGEKKTLEEQNRPERCFKWQVPIDHRGTLKRMIEYWSGHPTVRNPWLLQNPHAGGYHSGCSILWCPGTWQERDSSHGERPDRTNPVQKRGRRQASPADHADGPCFLPGQTTARLVPHSVGGPVPTGGATQGTGTRVGRWLTPWARVAPRGRRRCSRRVAVGRWAEPPCRKHGKATWGGRGSHPGGVCAAWGHPWVAVSPRGAACPPCPRGVRATRGHWNITEVPKRAQAPAPKGGLPSDATAFPLIISLDKIPEQRTDTRIYSLLCVSTAHYEVGNKNGVHKYPTMKGFMRRELVRWNMTFCCSCSLG